MGLDVLALVVSVVALVIAGLSASYTKKQAEETKRGNDLVAERMQQEAVKFRVELIPRARRDYTLRIHNTGTQTAFLQEAVLTRIRTSHRVDFIRDALAPGASHDKYLFGNEFSLDDGCDLVIKWSRKEFGSKIETWGPTSLTPPNPTD